MRFGAEACNELNSRCVLVLEAEALTLNAHLVDEDASIGLKSRKGNHQVLVYALDLADGARVLQFRNGVLLDSHDNAVRADESNGGTAAIDSLEGILDLEELAVRGEHSVRDIVAWHLSFLF